MEEITNKTIFDFLLGKMSEKNEPDFLGKCFDNDEHAEKYEMVRDSLIESYLKGRLTTEDRQRFETHFLSDPYHQELLEFSRTIRTNLKKNSHLERLAAAKPEAEKPGFFTASWLVPAMGVLILTIGALAWLIIKNPQNEFVRDVPPPDVQTPKTNETTKPAEDTPVTANSQTPDPNQNRVLPAQVKSPTPDAAKPPAFVPAFTLPVGIKGSADEETLKINKEAKQVKLKTSKLLDEKKFRIYRAVITDKTGKDVFISEEFSEFVRTDGGRKILFTVPANKFQDGEHTFILEGKKEDGGFEKLEGSKRDFLVKREK
jgi:hypothetical protein